MYIEDVVRGQSTGGYTMVYPYQLDYWMPDNTDAKFPRIAMNSSVNGNITMLPPTFGWSTDAIFV